MLTHHLSAMFAVAVVFRCVFSGGLYPGQAQLSADFRQKRSGDTACWDRLLGKLAQPLRAAVTGTSVSPGLFEVLELVGKERTLARIKRAVG